MTVLPTPCAWCGQPFKKGEAISNVVPSDEMLRIFHARCYTEIFDEILARENASIFRKKN